MKPKGGKFYSNAFYAHLGDGRNGMNPLFDQMQKSKYQFEYFSGENKVYNEELKPEDPIDFFIYGVDNGYDTFVLTRNSEKRLKLAVEYGPLLN